ncbi:hypothetical protein L2719_19770 [Shewanella schlegeliana]|uniref:Uncharacterized protein n=1 Tax=Shewanella schlegeliana TaxID=190308 RepID=A0ABS1SVF0_9GAMM|nr:hypothetical protein [Shewanella schlegeliana]MBL4911552.1 hypothetical protein [Shewanella schlegeliana]MCL1111763.1 hypothetical protein [Shewanella schlegeliana]GIU36019.1 hypothetical protein TUM4433_34180 [Shewanella schlegeliana]
MRLSSIINFPLLQFIPEQILICNETLYAFAYPTIFEEHPLDKLAELEPDKFKFIDNHLTGLREYLIQLLTLHVYYEHQVTNGEKAINGFLKNIENSSRLNAFDEVNDSRYYGSLVLGSLLGGIFQMSFTVGNDSGTPQIYKEILSKSDQDDSENRILEMFNRVFRNYTFDNDDTHRESLYAFFSGMQRCYQKELHSEALHFRTSLITEVMKHYVSKTKLDRDQMVEAVVYEEQLKSRSKKGNDKRHELNRKLKEKAIELYNAKNYRNPSQASKQLLHKIKDIAEKYELRVDDEHNFRTKIYNWFLAERKRREGSQAISN